MSFKSLSNQYQGTIYSPENHPDIEVDDPVQNHHDSDQEDQNHLESSNAEGTCDETYIDNDTYNESYHQSDNDSSNLNEDQDISDIDQDLDDLAERSEINRRILDNQLTDDEEQFSSLHSPLHDIVSNISNASESYQTLTQSDEDSDEIEIKATSHKQTLKTASNSQTHPQMQTRPQTKIQTRPQTQTQMQNPANVFRTSVPKNSSNSPNTSSSPVYRTSTIPELKVSKKTVGNNSVVGTQSCPALRASPGEPCNGGPALRASPGEPCNGGPALRASPSEPVIHKKVVKSTGHMEKIRVLTYNLWFDEDTRLERAQQIIHLIKKQQLEIVGLQEVVPETFELLIKYLKTDYLIYQIFIDEKIPYGDCLLLRRDKIKIIEPYFYDFPKTAMSRKILGCEIQVLGFSTTLHILNTHLESGRNNHELRAHQIQVIQEIINKHGIKNVIILGDFNITSLKEEAEDFLQRTCLNDVWVNIGCPVELKYTYDYRRNSRIQGKFRARLDRILYQLEFDHLLTGLKLVGVTREMPPPSDHFGLQAEFVFKKNF